MIYFYFTFLCKIWAWKWPYGMTLTFNRKTFPNGLFVCEGLWNFHFSMAAIWRPFRICIIHEVQKVLVLRPKLPTALTVPTRDVVCAMCTFGLNVCICNNIELISHYNHIIKMYDKLLTCDTPIARPNMVIVRLWVWNQFSIFVKQPWNIQSMKLAIKRVNPLTAKLFNLNFHPLEAVSRWRDPQLQVSENYYSDKIEVNSFQILLVDVTIIINIFKMWYLMY